MFIILELYQILFISSIVFILYKLSDMFIKMYGRFKLDNDVRFILSGRDKIILWLSISIVFSYLI